MFFLHRNRGIILYMGKIFILMGKSASGKDAIYRNLMADTTLGMRKNIMYTTRPMRQNEEEGVQYFFRTEEEFLAMREEGRIIEVRTYETMHGAWRYYTADDGQIDLSASSTLMGGGTIAHFTSIREYFGGDVVVPLYIEVLPEIRLERSLKREKRPENRRFSEMCRRFLADEEDFAPEKLEAAGIKRRFENNGAIEDCIREITEYIREKVEETQ